MVRLYLSLAYLQMEKLKEDLLYNGYDVIAVDEEEVDYIKTILRKRKIEFSEEIVR